MLQLRPYQEELKDAARAALKASDAVVAQLPTGGGKTAIATSIMGGVVERGKPAVFIVHRQELVDQTAETFAKSRLPFGIVSAGYPANPYQPIQIASVDTLRARLVRGLGLPAAALVGWDECHHIAASSWGDVKRGFGRVKHIGFTATPERLDGQGLRPHFDTLVAGPSVAELIAGGHLSPYAAWTPPGPETRALHVRMGDFIRGEAAALMDRPKITGDAIEHYQRHAQGRRGLAFCVSVEHSLHVAQQFREAGINAVHLDGGTDRKTRRDTVAAFRAGRVTILSNVDLFGEGFDVPDAEVSIGLRPTKSLALYLQQCGRVLRPAPGKRAVILDHAGNIRRHGLPDDPRTWTLDGRPKRKKKDEDAAEEAATLAQVECPECGVRHVKAPACPNCGTRYIAGGSGGGRAIEIVEGDLREAGQLAAIKGASLDELIALGQERGYRNPEQWARGYILSMKGG